MRHISFISLKQFSIMLTILSIEVNLSTCWTTANLLRSLDHGCSSNTDCFHGYCNDNKQCSCLAGWSGEHCEIQDIEAAGSSEKSKHNENLDKNSFNDKLPNHRHQKIHLRTKTIPVLYKKSKTNLLDINHSKSSTRIQPEVKRSVIRLNDNTYHVQQACSKSYKPHPIKHRLCLVGLTCQYGTCVVQKRQSRFAAFTFTCKCDQGASGLFCEKKCCLNCGKNGRCDMFQNGSRFCNCKLGYGGKRCEYKIPYRDY